MKRMSDKQRNFHGNLERDPIRLVYARCRFGISGFGTCRIFFRGETQRNPVWQRKPAASWSMCCISGWNWVLDCISAIISDWLISFVLFLTGNFLSSEHDKIICLMQIMLSIWVREGTFGRSEVFAGTPKEMLKGQYTYQRLHWIVRNVRSCRGGR